MLAPGLRVCGAGCAFLSLDATRFCALFQSSSSFTGCGCVPVRGRASCGTTVAHSTGDTLEVRMISGPWARAALLATAVCSLPAAGEAGSLTITWDPNDEPDVTRYSVHYGTQPGTYTGVVDAGNRTTLTIANLVDGQRYYLAVRAYSAAGLASSFSAEISGVTAAPAPTTGLVAAYGFEEASGSAITDASPTWQPRRDRRCHAHRQWPLWPRPVVRRDR